MNCPGCTKPLGALTAKPHCEAKACTWTRCRCGVTVDRVSGTGFDARQFYGSPTAT